MLFERITLDDMCKAPTTNVNSQIFGGKKKPTKIECEESLFVLSRSARAIPINDAIR